MFWWRDKEQEMTEEKKEEDSKHFSTEQDIPSGFFEAAHIITKEFWLEIQLSHGPEGIYHSMYTVLYTFDEILKNHFGWSNQQITKMKQAQEARAARLNYKDSFKKKDSLV